MLLVELLFQKDLGMFIKVKKKISFQLDIKEQTDWKIKVLKKPVETQFGK